MEIALLYACIMVYKWVSTVECGMRRYLYDSKKTAGGHKVDSEMDESILSNVVKRPKKRNYKYEYYKLNVQLYNTLEIILCD